MLSITCTDLVERLKIKILKQMSGGGKGGSLPTVTLPNNVTVAYGYDSDSHVTGLTYTAGSTQLGNLSYTYDAAGRRNSSGGSLAAVNLPAAISGNTFNADNGMTGFNGTALNYDSNGNLQGDGTNTYSWDARNHLVGISGMANASFVYDAFGRRMSKTVNGGVTQFVYDGWNPVQELNGANPPAVIANLLTGLSVDEFFARTGSGATWTLLTDALGSTIGLVNSSGTIATSYTYQPFGATTVSGVSSANPYQFTGRENDGTGLYFYRARYYSPTFQRFVSQDPIGVVGSETNTYKYVADDPVDFFDPHGLATTGNGVIVGGAVGGAGATVDVQIVRDTQGNYGVAVTVCGGGISQPLGVSVGGIHSSGNANTISDLQGGSLDVGTEISSENPLLPLGPMGGGSLTLGTDSSGNQTTTKNVCAGGSAGISPLEMSGMGCKTWVFP